MTTQALNKDNEGKITNLVNRKYDSEETRHNGATKKDFKISIFDAISKIKKGL